MLNGPRIGLVDGCRTPFTKAGGALADLSVHDLSVTVVRALAARTGIADERLGTLIMGSASPYPTVRYQARETAITLGWHRVNAYDAEAACATSARTLANACYELASGEAELAIAGGAESMSNVTVEARPAVRDALVASRKAGPEESLRILLSLTLGDLLPDPPSVSEPYSGRTLGEHTDDLARDWRISREAADAYAVDSHHKAAAATDDGRLPAETVPVETGGGDTVKQDALIRADTSLDKVAALPPAFTAEGSVTAANASPLTDGASAMLLAAEPDCERLGLTPRAWITSWAFTSHDPGVGVLLGPAYALPLALERAGLDLDDLGLVELHEAFAAQVLANLAAMASDAFARDQLGRARAMGAPDRSILNVAGGSVAIGHPFGATGGRLVVQLANEMQRRGVDHGALAICAGGARGAAIVLERAR